MRIQSLGVALASALTFILSAHIAKADTVHSLCQGEGDPHNSCRAAGVTSIDCDDFDRQFGIHQGMTPDEIKRNMGNVLCSYIDNGASKILPYSVVIHPSHSGGKCGWTPYTVTCLTR